MTTIVGVEPRALFDADHQNRRDHQRNDEGRKIEADFHSKQVRRTQQLMRPLQQFRRLRAGNRAHLVKKRLRTRHQRGVRSLRHLPRNHVLRGLQRRPVIVGQPQRHLDMKDIQQFDEVIRPARRHRAGAHGVFERQVPADDPRQQFAQRRIGVGVSAARQRNHGRELRVAESGKGASQS